MTEEALKNFGLSEAEFDRMVAGLRQGREQLFESIFLAHFPDCMKYLENHCHASPEDAYDATMETMLQFRRLLVAGKVRYQNLRFLFTRMAAQWYWKWKKKNPQPQSLDGIEPEAPAEDFDEETVRLLDRAWQQLGSKCQDLLKAFYYNGVQLIDLARELSKSDAALRQEKKRCVEKLRVLFFEMG